MITFLLLLGFIGADYFIPLMLTGVRGRSLAEAGVVITLGTVSWSIGSWWQSRAIVKTSSVTLIRLGGAILTVAVIGIMATLLGRRSRSRMSPGSPPASAWHCISDRQSRHPAGR